MRIIVISVARIIGVPDIAGLIARKHQAVLGLGVFIYRANRTQLTLQPIPAEILDIAANEHTAAGEIAMLAQLPRSRQDSHRAGTVVEIIIVQRIGRIEDFPHFTAKILTAEQHEAGWLIIGLVLRNCSARDSKRERKDGAEADQSGEHGQLPHS